MNHSLIVPFLNEDPTFAHGVEIGILYSLMSHSKEPIDNLFLADNQEQILLMANRLGWHVVSVGLCKDGWFSIRMLPPGSAA